MNINKNLKLKNRFKVTKKVKIIAALTLAAVIGGGSFTYHNLHATAAETEAFAMDTATVERMDLSKSITLNGTIISGESKELSSAVTDAKVLSTPVAVGDKVKKGDVIVVLSTESLEKQLNLAQTNLNNTIEKNKMDINEAERSLANAQSTINTQTAQAAMDLNNLTDKLHKNETDMANAQQDIQKYILEEASLQAEIDNCQDIYDSEQAVLRNKQRKLTKIQNGEEDSDDDHGDSSTTKLQLDIDQITNSQEDRSTHISDLKTKLSEVQSKRKEAESKLETAKDNITSFKQEIQKSQNSINETNLSNDKTIKDGQSSAELAKLNAEYSQKTAESDLEKVQNQIKEAVITAPIDGIVTNLNVSVGDTYKGDTIAVIQNISTFKASAEADQYDISDVAKDMKAVVTTKTTGDEEMQGKVTFVSPIPGVTNNSKDSTSTAKVSSNNYPIEVTLDDPSDRLRIGMTAKLKIIEKEAAGVLAVPSSYITTDDEGNSIVNVQSADGSTTTPVKVTVGLKTDYYVEIQSDEIKEGDTVVNDATSGFNDALSSTGNDTSSSFNDAMMY